MKLIWQYTSPCTCSIWCFPRWTKLYHLYTGMWNVVLEWSGRYSDTIKWMNALKWFNREFNTKVAPSVTWESKSKIFFARLLSSGLKSIMHINDNWSLLSSVSFLVPLPTGHLTLLLWGSFVWRRQLNGLLHFILRAGRTLPFQLVTYIECLWSHSQQSWSW